MKNFTQKMKSALFGVLAVLVMATPTKAQVTGVSDLFGKYKFTAKIEYTEAGKAYEGQYKETSDVEIKKHDIYDGQIVGLAGCQKGQTINGWDADTQSLKIFNPSFGGVWGNLAMSNLEGDYPYRGMQEGHENLFSTAYKYNAADGSITIPDFTLGECDTDAETYTVCAKFTNVKLELVELEKIDVQDLSGEWHYNAGKGQWDSMEGSTLPTEFDMILTATNDKKNAYSVKFVYGDFEPVNIPAEFNGAVFSLVLDSTALDVKERIYLTSSYSYTPYEDKVTFNYTSGGSLNLSSGMVVMRSDSLSPEKPKGQLQWFQGGVAKRKGAEVDFSWDGTYKMSADMVHNIGEGADFTKDFVMKVEKNENGYSITEMVGYKMAQNAMMLQPDETDPKKATIILDYYGLRILEMVDPGKTYRVLGDQNATVDGPIRLTLNADNTVSIENFCVLNYDFGTKESSVYGAFVGVKGIKEAAPVAPEFSWAQTFEVSAEVEVLNKDYEYPATFNMTVVREGDKYMVTEFLGNDISALNYGGASFAVSEVDPLKAALSAGAYLVMLDPGKFYLTLADKEGKDGAIVIMADEQGNLTFEDFNVMLFDYKAMSKTPAARYKNVKATLVSTGVENVQQGAKFWMNGGVLHLDQAQAVQVYNYAGKCVFSGVTAEIGGLVKGLYIVKTATGVAKVMVR